MTTLLTPLVWTPLKATALNTNAPGSNALNPLFSQFAAYINTIALAKNITHTPVVPTVLTNTILSA